MTPTGLIATKPFRRIALFRRMFLTVTFLCLGGVAIVYTITRIIYPLRIEIGGMKSTLDNGRRDVNGPQGIADWVLVNRASYLFSLPKRGDIVVFECSCITSKYVIGNTSLIRRIVGLPGETIQLKPPNVLVNGVTLTNPPVFLWMSHGTNGYTGYTYVPLMTNLAEACSSQVWRLGDEEYYVLGDNSLSSVDSRYFGAVNESSIRGKVIYVLSPSWRAGFPDDVERRKVGTMKDGTRGQPRK